MVVVLSWRTCTRGQCSGIVLALWATEALPYHNFLLQSCHESSQSKRDHTRPAEELTLAVMGRRGQQSFVQLALDKVTGQQVTVKFLRRNSLDVHTATREVVNQHACARHPHIVQLHVRSALNPKPCCPCYGCRPSFPTSDLGAQAVSE